jgi:hypothetical protein
MKTVAHPIRLLARGWLTSPAPLGNGISASRVPVKEHT